MRFAAASKEHRMLGYLLTIWKLLEVEGSPQSYAKDRSVSKDPGKFRFGAGEQKLPWKVEEKYGTCNSMRPCVQ